MSTSPYTPIEDYAAIGNLHTVALVGRDGSIDWCCLPHLDEPSVFAAILDHAKGGRFRVAPADSPPGTQRYIPDTNVLETTWETHDGHLTLTDFMPLRATIRGAGEPPTAPQIYRILRCERGEVTAEVEWAPRFDYARAATSVANASGVVVASGGGATLTLAGLPPHADVALDAAMPTLRARFPMRAGEQIALLTWYGAGAPRWDVDDWRGALADTVNAWREWLHSREQSESHSFAGEWQGAVDRSGLALKLLTFPDTGAIAAAATTSLPEQIGGVRNWDYRYTWIRDASFTAQALVAIGHREEAVDFLGWTERLGMQTHSREPVLRVMYGLRGETDLREVVLPHLEGYRGSRPVRIGNAAAVQLQLDIYGEMLRAAAEILRHGGQIDSGLWAFLARVADEACDRWREPDNGIWEVRGGPRHFVYSKVMVWVALDRALRLAHRFGLHGDTGRWRRERRAIRAAVLAEGYDAQLGTFVQAFGSKALDAANLLIPTVGFLPWDDPRIHGTIDRTLERLTANGLVYRYVSGDGLPGNDGAFGLTTFWMVDALALTGRASEAREMFEGVARRANHVGLFSEEFNPHTGAFLGNFPQAFSHIGHINSALYIAAAEGGGTPVAPLGTQREQAETKGHAAGSDEA